MPSPGSGSCDTQTAAKAPGRSAPWWGYSRRSQPILALLRQAGASDLAPERRERWAEAHRLLLSHERAEAQIVYAAVQDHEAASKVLQHHREQAAEIELAAAELELDDGSEPWLEHLRDVIALLDDHVRDEEEDPSPSASSAKAKPASSTPRCKPCKETCFVRWGEGSICPLFDTKPGRDMLAGAWRKTSRPLSIRRLRAQRA